MRRGAYLKQLKLDIERWVREGLVDASKVEAMLASAGPEAKARSLAFILSFLGAILLGLAAIVFVGANWQAWPRAAKLAVLVVAMWLIYGVAIALIRRRQPAFAQAALLFAIAMYGANIMLIGQIYHINAGWPGGVMLWGLGALLAALVVPSRAAGAFATVLFTIWTVGAVTDVNWTFHWPFLVVWLALVVFALRMAWPPQVHLALIAFAIWSAINAVSVGDHYNAPASLVMLALLAIALLMWIVGRIGEARDIRFGGTLAAYGLLATALVFFLVQISDRGGPVAWPLLGVSAGLAAAPVAIMALVAFATKSLRLLDLLAVVFVIAVAAAKLATGPESSIVYDYAFAAAYLVFVVWLIGDGLTRHSAFTVNLGFVAFGAQMIYLYFTIFGTMLGQSLFLAIGGLLFIAAAFALETTRRRLLSSGANARTGGAA